MSEILGADGLPAEPKEDVRILDSKGGDARETLKRRNRSILTGTYSPNGPTPEPGWQEALDRIAPPDPDGVESWLLLYWEQGYPWEPINRWMIGQVVPWKRMPPPMMEIIEFHEKERNGADPRKYGYWDQILEQYVYDGPPYTRRQWDHYARTRALSPEGIGQWLTTFWVVQGENGGHKRYLTKPERSLLGMHDGMDTWPKPGDLPFSNPTDETFLKIEQCRRSVELMQTLAALDENPEIALDHEEEIAMMQARKQVWDWLAPHTEEVADELSRNSDMKHEFLFAQHSDTDWTEKTEQLYEDFITNG